MTLNSLMNIQTEPGNVSSAVAHCSRAECSRLVQAAEGHLTSARREPSLHTCVLAPQCVVFKPESLHFFNRATEVPGKMTLKSHIVTKERPKTARIPAFHLNYLKADYAVCLRKSASW